jgi:hypothetical protein
MSMNRLEIIQHPERSCNFSKSVDLKIGTKTITTPAFSLRVKNEVELDLLLQLKRKYSLRFLSTYVVRLLDAPRSLHWKIKELSQKNLLGEAAKPDFPKSLQTDLIFVDPALEYLLYHAEDTLSKFQSLFFLPKTVRDYALRCSNEQKVREKKDFKKWQEAYHRKFWSDILDDEQKRTRLIRDFHELEIKNKADVLIPPVPLITSQTLLDASIKINEKSREFSRGKKESADYFLLRIDAHRNDEIMDKIKQHIENSEDCRLTIFKIKNMNLNNEESTVEKNAFKSLLMELAFISSHVPNKAFMLLEAGNQTFPSALTGFDIVSTSFNGDKDDRHSRIARSPYAKWYDPEYMNYRSREELVQIKNNNGQNAIPCNCPVCLAPSFLTEDQSEYNRNVKKHYIFCRNSEMKEIYDAIEKKTIGLAADKISRSQLKNLVDLIPWNQ